MVELVVVTRDVSILHYIRLSARPTQPPHSNSVGIRGSSEGLDGACSWPSSARLGTSGAMPVPPPPVHLSCIQGQLFIYHFMTFGNGIF